MRYLWVYHACQPFQTHVCHRLPVMIPGCSVEVCYPASRTESLVEKPDLQDSIRERGIRKSLEAGDQLMRRLIISGRMPDTLLGLGLRLCSFKISLSDRWLWIYFTGDPHSLNNNVSNRLLSYFIRETLARQRPTAYSTQLPACDRLFREYCPIPFTFDEN